MKKLDRRGFTLVELIATIVVLALVVGIGSYSITGLIKNAKEKDYELLVKEIKNAVEEYHIECKYAETDAISCPVATLIGENESYEIELSKLINYGYLKPNGVDDTGNSILVNPKDDVPIGECKIRYMYYNDKYEFDYDNSTNVSCPEVR